LTDKKDEKTIEIQFDFENPFSNIDQLSTPDDIYEHCNEELLRKLFEIEDSRLEKKAASTQPRQLGEYFSMWANTGPHGGLLVVGIKDDTYFEGCSAIGQNRINEIEKTGATFCSDAEIKSKRIDIHRDKDGEKDFVFVFRIYYNKTRVVLTTSGEAFRRVDDTKRKLTAADIRHLQNEKGEISFETELCRLKYPDDFDIQAVEAFVSHVRTSKRWSEFHSSEQILELMHLGNFENENFIPNIAFAVLFAKDPRNVIPGCRVRFLRFSGNTEGTGSSWNAIKDEFIDGAIPSLITKTSDVLKSQLRMFSKLDSHGKFSASAEYPDFAWYEAIVNACAHRSYGNGMKNMTVFIKMFDDRLEIESPGSFPPFVTPQNIYFTHNPRNPIIMDAMYYLQFVRCAHEGTRRIKDAMAEAKLPEPIFSQRHTESATVCVTLKNNIRQRQVWLPTDVAEIIGAQISRSLSEEQRLCINFAAENGNISVSDAQRLTGMTWPSARKMLGMLVDMSIFVHEHKEGKDRDPKARFKLRNQ